MNARPTAAMVRRRKTTVAMARRLEDDQGDGDRRLVSRALKRPAVAGVHILVRNDAAVEAADERHAAKFGAVKTSSQAGVIPGRANVGRSFVSR